MFWSSNELSLLVAPIFLVPRTLLKAQKSTSSAADPKAKAKAKSKAKAKQPAAPKRSRNKPEPEAEEEEDPVEEAPPQKKRKGRKHWGLIHDI